MTNKSGFTEENSFASIRELMQPTPSPVSIIPREEVFDYEEDTEFYGVLTDAKLREFSQEISGTRHVKI